MCRDIFRLCDSLGLFSFKLFMMMVMVIAGDEHGDGDGDDAGDDAGGDFWWWW